MTDDVRIAAKLEGVVKVSDGIGSDGCPLAVEKTTGDPNDERAPVAVGSKVIAVESVASEEADDMVDVVPTLANGLLVIVACCGFVVSEAKVTVVVVVLLVVIIEMLFTGPGGSLAADVVAAPVALHCAEVLLELELATVTYSMFGV